MMVLFQAFPVTHRTSKPCCQVSKMHKTVLYHVFGGHLCAVFRTSNYLEMPPLPIGKRNFTTNLIMFKHKHGYRFNRLFPADSTESYDHMVVNDDVPLLENPSDSFLNDI
jgi:hypothetical protein